MGDIGLSDSLLRSVYFILFSCYENNYCSYSSLSSSSSSSYIKTLIGGNSFSYFSIIYLFLYSSITYSNGLNTCDSNIIYDLFLLVNNAYK